MHLKIVASFVIVLNLS